ncbi:hypothetical protein [Streptomyces sp. x-80]|uniref:hypothetical protein n=1 Tax=Streptomyces sp. x-80 TaxID=2789282 RepID=UPI003980880D
MSPTARPCPATLLGASREGGGRSERATALLTAGAAYGHRGDALFNKEDCEYLMTTVLDGK